MKTLPMNHLKLCSINNKLQQLNFTELLPYAMYFSKHFTHNSLYNSHNEEGTEIILIFYKGRLRH